MVDATHISFAADDRSYFSLLKKEIHKRALDAGINIKRINELDLIVAEMTSNLFKYANGGEILMGIFTNGGSPYVELISIDRGPGISNIAKMMQDGVSTTNTMGNGLGSIKRLSDVFEIYSIPDWGTIILSRVYNDSKSVKNTLKADVRSIILSKPGETCSGDGFIYKINNDYLKIMLADGLGHGPEANKAVNEAAEAFRVFPEYSPTETIRFIHSAIRKTRGAVAAIVCYDFNQKKWTMTGIGNIATKLVGVGALRNHMSYNGIVGHNIPNTMNDQVITSEQFNQVILCSDGIKTRWDLSRFPLISKYDLSILAAAIYKDQARKTDDMSIIVTKLK
ncbi:SpoIIE family protein phosphatase [Mucilaginibacter paludis]|uniref:Stage II sporulation protein E n=1 Tax=Mucilaginibacter paludis DSM 18603 TaxID=714943 RepID=H1YEX6_9SPHI|nr:SpoIIE family protein phosphatase [Mucilaginibacter paludis]EHQ24393.1 Stage II sporulation protein E [Mucilaginibacter paludis DSM 18603]